MQSREPKRFRCVLHGSFRKHFQEIQRVRKLFESNGIEVLAPSESEILKLENGFAVLDSDQEKDQRMIELLYLHHLKQLGENGFSYFVNPDGYIGKSGSYELGIAQISNVHCFFSEKLQDHPAYLHQNAVWKPELLVEYILSKQRLPEPVVKPDDAAIHQLWVDLMVPGSVVAVGGIIEYAPERAGQQSEVLLVQTHKWGNRFSIVGGKVRRNERLEAALLREIEEETGLAGKIGEHICTFDQVKDSGYYVAGMQHIFVDKVVYVQSKKVRLNDEAQSFVWAPPEVALRDLPVEPNARFTLELYAQQQATRALA